MVCSIISDMEITVRLRERLVEEIEKLTDTYAQVDFLVGDLSGVERTAQEILGQITRSYYFVNCFKVGIEPKGQLNVLVPEAIEMVKPECVVAWRNRWMLKKSEMAIICLNDRSVLPKPEDIHRMTVIDISR